MPYIVEVTRDVTPEADRAAGVEHLVTTEHTFSAGEAAKIYAQSEANLTGRPTRYRWVGAGAFRLAKAGPYETVKPEVRG